MIISMADSRRDFLKKAVAGTVGLTVGGNVIRVIIVILFMTIRINW